MSDKYFNNLKMRGCQEDILAVKNWLRTKKSDGTIIEYDMEKIIPVPRDYDINEPIRHGYLSNIFLKDIQQLEITDIQRCLVEYSNLSSEEKVQELKDIVNKITNKEKYGSEDYTDWNYENLGCKYVHQGEYDVENDMIIFLTSNGNGIKILQALARKFPIVLFEMEFEIDVYVSEEYGFIEIKGDKILSYGAYKYTELPADLEPYKVNDDLPIDIFK
jgi:hypothetical protein